MWSTQLARAGTLARAVRRSGRTDLSNFMDLNWTFLLGGGAGGDGGGLAGTSHFGIGGGGGGGCSGGLAVPPVLHVLRIVCNICTLARIAPTDVTEGTNIALDSWNSLGPRVLGVITNLAKPAHPELAAAAVSELSTTPTTGATPPCVLLASLL